MLPALFDILPRSPCSLPFFGARSFLPIFTAPFSSLFAPCSFFLFFLLLHYNFSCSLLHFQFCLLLPATFPIFLCSLLPDYVFLANCSLPHNYYRSCFLLLAPLGLKGLSPCSLITPNGGSLITLAFRLKWNSFN